MTKHVSFLLLSSMATVALHAESKEVQWDQLCQVARGHEIAVKTQGGETVYGYCSDVTGEELTIGRKGKGAVKVAKSALAKVEMRELQGGQLKKLHREFRGAMKFSVGTLLSPAAVGGLVAVPVVAAWGATALPFCALGDLVAKLAKPVELRPI